MDKDIVENCCSSWSLCNICLLVIFVTTPVLHVKIPRPLCLLTKRKRAKLSSAKLYGNGQTNPSSLSVTNLMNSVHVF